MGVGIFSERERESESEIERERVFVCVMLGIFVLWTARVNFHAQIGRRPKGSSSPRQRPVLDTFWKRPFSEPLLRTLPRTLFDCKTHSKTPSKKHFWESTKASHKRVFALLTPEIHRYEMAQMPSKNQCSRSRAVSG